MFKTIKEKFFPSYKPNDREQLIVDIIESLLSDADTECITAPISGKYYITNKRLSYWVKVSGENITITNHKFTFSSNAVLTFNDYVIGIIRDYLEKDRQEFEDTVFENEIELLENIKSNIKFKK